MKKDDKNKNEDNKIIEVDTTKEEKTNNSDITVFTNDNFGNIRTIEINGEPWFVGKDVAAALGYTDVKHAILDHVDSDDRVNSKTQGQNDPEFGQRGTWLINESGLYSLILSSKLPSAKEFKHWVTSEVIPTIRKTGGYVNNDELFINTYLPFADEQTKLLFSTTLATVRNQNYIIQKQKAENERLLDDNNHKQEIINGFTDDIDIYKKKDIINRICRRKHENYASRYTELYRCFKENNHINLEARCEGYNLKQTKKKDKLSVIKYAEQFGYIDDLYSCCVKLYESEVKEIIEQLNELQN